MEREQDVGLSQQTYGEKDYRRQQRLTSIAHSAHSVGNATLLMLLSMLLIRRKLSSPTGKFIVLINPPTLPHASLGQSAIAHRALASDGTPLAGRMGASVLRPALPSQETPSSRRTTTRHPTRRNPRALDASTEDRPPASPHADAPFADQSAETPGAEAAAEAARHPEGYVKRWQK